MKKLNAKGFSAVEVLLVLVIIGLIGGAGYYVYSANKKTNESLDNTGNSELSKSANKKETPKPKEDITAEWYEFKSYSGLFSMKIPDGWKLGASEGLGGLAGFCGETPSCVTYKQGTRGAVQKVEGGRGGPFRFNLFEGEATVAKSFMTRGTKSGEIKADDVSVIKNIYEQKTEPEGPDIAKGGKEYSYLWIKGDKGIYITYSIYSQTEKDEVTYVDAAVASLKPQN